MSSSFEKHPGEDRNVILLRLPHRCGFSVYCGAMKIMLTLACAIPLSTAMAAAQSQPMALPKVAPTIDQVLSLKRAGSPEISPDGRWIAYTVRETNWDDNAYDTQIWLADAT